MSMSTTRLDRLRSEALQLGDAERAELARDLVRSLDAPDEADASRAWDQEVARRLTQLDEGTAKLIDREELERRLRARLGR
jgi:putative addiction module component (TIGR02574 family)